MQNTSATKVIRRKGAKRFAATRRGQIDEAASIQMSHLNLVLTGFETVAGSASKHISVLRQVVRSGVYQVDTVALSRRIVDEACSPA